VKPYDACLKRYRASDFISSYERENPSVRNQEKATSYRKSMVFGDGQYPREARGGLELRKKERGGGRGKTWNWASKKKVEGKAKGL